MGCSTSSQTSAVDTTRPSSKPEESNGASATGTAGAGNNNDHVAEPSVTTSEQGPAEDGDANPADKPFVAADSTAAAPPAGDPEPAGAPHEPAAAPPAGEPEPAAAPPESAAAPPEPATAGPPADAEAPAAGSPELAATSTVQEADVAADGSKPTTVAAPAPSN